MELVNRLFDVCQSLAGSQGFYGRLLHTLCEMSEDDLSNLENEMEQQLGV